MFKSVKRIKTNATQLYFIPKKLKRWQELQVEVLMPQRLTFPYRLSVSSTNLYWSTLCTYHTFKRTLRMRLLSPSYERIRHRKLSFTSFNNVLLVLILE